MRRARRAVSPAWPAVRRPKLDMRRALIAAGALVMAYAVAGALFDGDVNKVGVALFLIAVLVLHDAVFLPLVIGAGALIGRFVPVRWQSTTRVAALISLAVSVVALPLVLGFGRSPDNPSALPLPYGRGLIVILILIWIGSLGARKGMERRRARRGG
ncbi:MAG TPA: hypothetical protein VGQ92_09140 [Actinoplanes sp.]|nr:hypothetical protein [Actinoplanes sp.]